jgi:PilZ domain
MVADGWGARFLSFAPMQDSTDMNNRKAARVELRYVAGIEIAGRTIVPCHILDVSATGARLRVGITANLPDSFTLNLDMRRHHSRHCRLVWRARDQVGVRFVQAPTTTAEADVFKV